MVLQHNENLRSGEERARPTGEGFIEEKEILCPHYKLEYISMISCFIEGRIRSTIRERVFSLLISMVMCYLVSCQFGEIPP